MRGRLLLLCVGLFITFQCEAASLSVVTQHNDVSRTGANLFETVLTTSNANTVQFGKIFARAVDGQIYAQPLYLQNIAVANQGIHNVVYVCTEHNTVFAFDADNPNASTPLWQQTLAFPVPSSDSGCSDLSPEMGITATPVIDPPDSGTATAGTIYVLSNSKENNAYYYKLWALDVASGAPKFNSPVIINATAGAASLSGLLNNGRAGLLLANKCVYMAFASHCDIGPYWGWVLKYDAVTLAQTASFCTTADGSEGGIWQSGNGLAADSAGNIYFMTGNGTFSKNTGGSSLGSSFVKLDSNLNLLDYFTPSNYDSLNQADEDVGSGGPALLPGTHFLTGCGKDGTLWLLDQNNLGEFNSKSNKVVQSIPNAISAGNTSCGPLYWNGAKGQFVYYWNAYDNLKQFKFDGALFSTSPVYQSSNAAQGVRAGGIALSANGNKSGTGIVWGFRDANVVEAYDAENVSRLLWSSAQNPNRDGIGTFSKLSAPTIVNGRVYVPTRSNQLVVYGLLNGPTVATAATATPNPTSATAASLSVLGADKSGESKLTYTWNAIGTPPMPVTFGANGTNAAKKTSATFAAPGTYLLQVTIRNPLNLTITSTVAVTVTASFTSPISATPNPGTAGQSTLFNVGTLPLVTLTWDFGDGSPPANGVSVSHTYSAGGTFDVVVTSTDLNGTSNAEQMSYTVIDPPDPPPTGNHGPNPPPPGNAPPSSPPRASSPGNGLPPEINAAFDNDPAKMPFGNAVFGAPQPMALNKIGIRLNFINFNSDAISLTGFLPIPVGLVVAGQPITVDVGGVIRTFTLDAKGNAKFAVSPGSNPSPVNDRFSVLIKSQQSAVFAQMARFQARFSQSSFATELTDENLTSDSLVTNSPSTVRIIVVFNGQIYQTDQPVLYTATSKMGTAK